MPYSEVAKPVAGAEAFQSNDDASILSQSAILLGLGIELRGEGPLPEGRLQALVVSRFPNSFLRMTWRFLTYLHCRHHAAGLMHNGFAEAWNLVTACVRALCSQTQRDFRPL